MDGTIHEFLVGTELSAVCFVRDYIEFHFDGPILRALSNPTCSMVDVVYQYPERGSRDALCELIGLEVREVKVLQSQYIQCMLGNGYMLSIPLTQPNPFSGESAHFILGEHKPIAVW